MTVIPLLIALLGTPAHGEAPDTPTLSDDERARALRRYRRDHLQRGGYHSTTSTAIYTPGSTVGDVYVPGTVTPITSTIDTWTVYDGTGTMLTPATFARRIGDDTTRRLLDDERKSASTGGILVGMIGAAAFIKSMSVATSDDPSAAALTTWALIGGVGLGVGIAWPLTITQKQRYVSRYWSTRQVDDEIERYNDALRERLKLREEDLPAE